MQRIARHLSFVLQIKSFTKPPALVQMTMEAVCILKQEKADWDTVRSTQDSRLSTSALSPGHLQNRRARAPLHSTTARLAIASIKCSSLPAADDPLGASCCSHAGQARAVRHELHAELGGVRQGQRP